jgi:flagellar hook protein FlgE
MALSSALFSGITGMSTLGEAMQVIGDNIANVNTVGFKASNYTFQDLLSQSVATQSGTSQVGKGTALSDIYQDFQQGSFETTSSPTDLAIGGSGFFQLREPAGENIYLTRSGNFRFDKDGYLVNPSGYVVQGWKMNEKGQDEGTVTNILLDSFTSPPKPSDEVKLILNLDKSADAANDNNIWESWDATEAAPISPDHYIYQSSVKVYDVLGDTHDISLYFDKADGTDHEWQYIVTCNPSEDLRGYTDADAATPLEDSAAAGLLARGTIEFYEDEDSGKIKDITMDLLQDGGDYTDLSDAGCWAAADKSTSGYFQFTPKFIAGGGDAMEVGLNLGSSFNAASSVWKNDSLTTTQFSKASTTVFQSANGYGAGDLQGVNVDVDGVITGTYSNGEVLSLYRVAVAKVVNPVGLEKVGGNLFKTTALSGEAPTYRPGTNGTGKIAPNSLEQSNVDIANEFVKMITTQRGFQANGKIITVTDQMLQELINLKR